MTNDILIPIKLRGIGVRNSPGLYLGVKLGVTYAETSKRKTGWHIALITPRRSIHVKSVKKGKETFVEFSDFNEVREVFEEAIRRLGADVRELSDPSS